MNNKSKPRKSMVMTFKEQIRSSEIPNTTSLYPKIQENTNISFSSNTSTENLFIFQANKNNNDINNDNDNNIKVENKIVNYSSILELTKNKDINKKKKNQDQFVDNKNDHYKSLDNNCTNKDWTNIVKTNESFQNLENDNMTKDNFTYHNRIEVNKILKSNITFLDQMEDNQRKNIEGRRDTIDSDKLKDLSDIIKDTFSQNQEKSNEEISYNKDDGYKDASENTKTQVKKDRFKVEDNSLNFSSKSLINSDEIVKKQKKLIAEDEILLSNRKNLDKKTNRRQTIDPDILNNLSGFNDDCSENIKTTTNMVLDQHDVLSFISTAEKVDQGNNKRIDDSTASIIPCDVLRNNKKRNTEKEEDSYSVDFDNKITANLNDYPITPFDNTNKNKRSSLDLLFPSIEKQSDNVEPSNNSINYSPNPENSVLKKTCIQGNIENNEKNLNDTNNRRSSLEDILAVGDNFKNTNTDPASIFASPICPTPATYKKNKNQLKSCLSSGVKKKLKSRNHDNFSSSNSTSVTFGSPRGAMFFKENPPGTFTPICNNVAKKMFLLVDDNNCSDNETKKQVDQETKENEEILARFDDDYDHNGNMDSNTKRRRNKKNSKKVKSSTGELKAASNFKRNSHSVKSSSIEDSMDFIESDQADSNLSSGLKSSGNSSRNQSNRRLSLGLIKTDVEPSDADVVQTEKERRRFTIAGSISSSFKTNNNKGVSRQNDKIETKIIVSSNVPSTVTNRNLDDVFAHLDDEDQTVALGNLGNLIDYNTNTEFLPPIQEETSLNMSRSGSNGNSSDNGLPKVAVLDQNNFLSPILPISQKPTLENDMIDEDMSLSFSLSGVKEKHEIRVVNAKSLDKGEVQDTSIKIESMPTELDTHNPKSAYDKKETDHSAMSIEVNMTICSETADKNIDTRENDIDNIVSAPNKIEKLPSDLQLVKSESDEIVNTSDNLVVKTSTYHNVLTCTLLEDGKVGKKSPTSVETKGLAHTDLAPFNEEESIYPNSKREESEQKASSIKPDDNDNEVLPNTQTIQNIPVIEHIERESNIKPPSEKLVDSVNNQNSSGVSSVTDINNEIIFIKAKNVFTSPKTAYKKKKSLMHTRTINDANNSVAQDKTNVKNVSENTKNTEVTISGRTNMSNGNLIGKDIKLNDQEKEIEIIEMISAVKEKVLGLQKSLNGDRKRISDFNFRHKNNLFIKSELDNKICGNTEDTPQNDLYSEDIINYKRKNFSVVNKNFLFLYDNSKIKKIPKKRKLVNEIDNFGNQSTLMSKDNTKMKLVCSEMKLYSSEVDTNDQLIVCYVLDSSKIINVAGFNKTIQLIIDKKTFRDNAISYEINCLGIKDVIKSKVNNKEMMKFKIFETLCHWFLSEFKEKLCKTNNVKNIIHYYNEKIKKFLNLLHEVIDLNYRNILDFEIYDNIANQKKEKRIYFIFTSVKHKLKLKVSFNIRSHNDTSNWLYPIVSILYGQVDIKKLTKVLNELPHGVSLLTRARNMIHDYLRKELKVNTE